MARARRGFYIRIDDDIDKYIRKGMDAADDAAFAACKEGVEVARSKAPKGETGKLAESIQVGKAKKGEATISVGVPYGVFQEFGTNRHQGHHYLRQGISAAQRVWAGHVQRQL